MKRVLAMAAAAALGVIATIYLPPLISGSIDIEYLLISDELLELGETTIHDSFIMEISKIRRDSEEYQRLRVLVFQIRNVDWRDLPENSKYFFYNPVDGVRLKGEPSRFVYFKSSQPHVPLALTGKPVHGKELGFEITSSIPAGSRLAITLLLPLNDKAKEARQPIAIAKQYKSGEALSAAVESAKLDSWEALVIGLSLGITYASIWLVINIFLGNYSSGAHIVNSIFLKIFRRGFIPQTALIERAQRRLHERLRKLNIELDSALREKLRSLEPEDLDELRKTRGNLEQIRSKILKSLGDSSG